MWFIVGIGEAIAVRDRAMEAADHAAFSAAAVHARGMNYISALNVLMASLTAVYVVAATVANILLILGGIGGVVKHKMFGLGHAKCRQTANPLGLIPEVHAVASEACHAGHAMAKLDEDLGKDLVETFKGISELQSVIKVGIPVAAEAAAVAVADQYAYHGLVLSPSVVPDLNHSGGKIGLPLKNINYDFLCRRAYVEAEKEIKAHVPKQFQKVLHYVTDDLEEKLMKTPPRDTNGNTLGTKVGGIGCKGGHPWGDAGLPVVADGVENGSDYLQMWSVILNAKDDNVTGAEQRVGMAKNKGAAEAPSPAKKRIYYSQAEYYFDCTAKHWNMGDCNDPKLLNPSFQMAWRARLRRVYAPSFHSRFVQSLGDFLLAGNANAFIAGKVGNNGAARKVADEITKFRNGVFSTHIVNTEAGDGLDTALDFLNGGDKPIH